MTNARRLCYDQLILGTELERAAVTSANVVKDQSRSSWVLGRIIVDLHQHFISFEADAS